MEDRFVYDREDDLLFNFEGLVLETPADVTAPAEPLDAAFRKIGHRAHVILNLRQLQGAPAGYIDILRDGRVQRAVRVVPNAVFDQRLPPASARQSVRRSASSFMSVGSPPTHDHHHTAPALML